MVEKVQDTHLYKWLSERKSEFIGQLDEVIKYAENMLPLINDIFTNYTVHGIKHSVNVMEYMYALIADINQLSELEVTMLIYCALLHDIGMISNNKEIENIKEDKVPLGERKYSKVYEKYKNEKIALQECIRPVHGKRAKEYIQDQMEKKWFLIPNSTVVSFQEELGLICMSHNEDFEWLEKMLTNRCNKGYFNLNSQYIAILLRIADYLDIDEQRAPLYLYKYLQPKDYSDLEWKQHFVIENYDKVKWNEKIGQKEIIFEGKSQEPSVHRKLLRYFDSINGELKNAVGLCERFADSKYLLNLKPNVINKVQTQGFSFSDLRLTLDYNAVTNLLMGEHIYGDKKYGLREIIQNSIDACKTMEESSTQMEEFRYSPYQPSISLILDKDRKQVMIVDNGSGMSIDILKKYFLNVGVSYYASDDYLLQGRQYSPIGHYGIGFLACFMLSDRVEVKTAYYTDSKANKITFEKNSEYICLTYEEKRQQGTEIILDYDQVVKIFDNKIENIVSFVEQNFLDSGIPIKVSMMENGKMSTVDCIVKKIENMLSNPICLNEYLDGVEAYVDCTYKQINFATHLIDLNGCASYYYDDENYSLKGEDDLLIKDCVNEDGMIVMMIVPIVSDNEEDNFLKAYEVLEDYEEALFKIGNYELVNIWAQEDEISSYCINVDEANEEIIGGYTLAEFRKQFGHASFTPLQTSYIKQPVISNSSNMVLPYNESCVVSGNNRWERVDLSYIKNVLISGLKIRIPYVVNGIVLKGAVINITNPEFIPNVSRNNINTTQQDKLSYAIGKALHLWIRDNSVLASEQKELLNLFIETKYSRTNCCLK